MASSLKRASGFSLIEIMVAMLIGLIGTIIIFQVFAISEAQKRTTTGVSDAQQNGLLALFAVEREARMAGYGVSYEPTLGCNVLAHDSGNAAAIPPIPARDFTFTLSAVQITDGAAGAPDSVTFVYGNSNLSVLPAKLTTSTVAGVTMNKVENRFGYLLNDLIIAGEPSKDCSLRQISALPSAVGSLDQIEHTAGRYNKAGGLTVAYSAWDNTSLSGGRLYSLGQAPTVVTYRINNNQLEMRNLVSQTAFTPVVEAIVQMQAEYGKDSNGNGDVDTWDTTAPANPIEWGRVIAVRLAIVARSQTPERPNQTTFLCDTTTSAPTWKGGTAIPVSADADWMCYRYRTFETTVPIRNHIWKPE
jgi:type IV pilus assembly protein PilW